MPMRALLVAVVVLLSHHVSADASTLQNKGLSCRPPAPSCPFSSAQWDSYWREWTCPSTCSDGSTPTCLIEPCSTARCAGACVNNYCPNHPVKGSRRCTASCVTPVNCIRDPCQVASGQPSLCPRGKKCQPDYRFGCGFTCEPVTCTWNDEVYQIHDSRLDDDGCSTCSCTFDGTWYCSKKHCPIPTTPPPVTCTFNDRIYLVNETRPKGDGCNICSCTPNGDWMCTLRPCMRPTTPAPTTPTPTIPTTSAPTTPTPTTPTTPAPTTPTPTTPTTPAPILAWCGPLVGCTTALCGGLFQNVATWGVASSSMCIDVNGGVTLDIGGLFDLMSDSVLSETVLQVWASSQSANWIVSVIGTVTTNQKGDVHVTFQTTGLLLPDGSFEGRFVINQPQIRSQFLAGPPPSTRMPPTTRPTIRTSELPPPQGPTTRTPTLPPPRIPAPFCPFGSAVLGANNVWNCPSTCSDGSPPVCSTRPCSNTTCGLDEVCVDNYCPNFPLSGDRCTAHCVKPVAAAQCAHGSITTPCDLHLGQPLCGTPFCRNDYSLGCNYRCDEL